MPERHRRLRPGNGTDRCRCRRRRRCDHLAEIGEQPVLGRVLVEERRQQQRAAAAEFGGAAGQQHGVGHRRRAGARQQHRGRDAALDQPLHDRDALVDAEAVGLARWCRGCARPLQPLASSQRQCAAMRSRSTDEIGAHRRSAPRRSRRRTARPSSWRVSLLGCWRTGAAWRRARRRRPGHSTMWCSSGPASPLADGAAAHRDAGAYARSPDRRTPAGATRPGRGPRPAGDRRRTAAASRSRAAPRASG